MAQDQSYERVGREDQRLLEQVFRQTISEMPEEWTFLLTRMVALDGLPYEHRPEVVEVLSRFKARQEEIYLALKARIPEKAEEESGV